ncbi:MAG: hypothetical protein ACK44D_01310 [Bacteroidia bacterium]
MLVYTTSNLIVAGIVDDAKQTILIIVLELRRLVSKNMANMQNET